MKKLLLIPLFICCYFTSSGQNSNCKYQVNEKDEFTGTIKKISTEFSFVKGTISKSPFLYFNLGKFIQNNDTLRILYMQSSGAKSFCFSSESKIMIKCGETIIELPFIGKVDCGKSIKSYAILKDEDIQILSKFKVDKVRIYYSEGYIDFDNIHNDYFINNLICIE